MKSTRPIVTLAKRASICKLWVGRAAVLLWVVASAAGCSTDEPAVQEDPAAVAVRTAQVTRRDLTRRIGYVGTVHSQREVRVLAQTAGTVLWLTKEGDVVREGDPVARLTAPEADARVSRMGAEVQRARLERDFLCKTHETDELLADKGAISKTTADLSRRACNAATAGLSAARAGSREVGAFKGKSIEAAPFEGMVLRWLVEPGQNVMPGTPLMLIGSRDLEVRIPVAERDLDRGVRPGIPAWVALGEDTRRLSVSRVAPMAVGLGRTSEVSVALPGHPKPVHGTSTRVDFVVDEVEGAVSVPDRALSTDGETSRVFVIEGGRASAVVVATGIHDQGFRQVEGELNAGAWVAVTNLDLLRDGADVFAVPSAQEVQP